MELKDIIQMEKVRLNNVPCIIVKPKEFHGKLPTLVHYHGWSSRKENHRFLATTIAMYGYQVILPDSIFHGERNSLEEYTSENLQKYFWQVVTTSIEEFNDLLREAMELYPIDRDKIAVSGSSMGGFITSSIFAQNDTIKTLITYNGASAWKKAEEVLIENLGSEVTKEIDREELYKLDPISYKNKFYPRPILMLHGDADTSVPIEIQRYFYREVSPLYKENQNKLRLEEYRNMNHHISIKMVESTVNWLNKYMS